MVLFVMGKEGLGEVAMQCLQKAAYLRNRVAEIPSVVLPFAGPIYNEFVVRTPRAAVEVLAELEQQQILGGIALGDFHEGSERYNHTAATEIHTREHLDQFVAALSAAIPGER